MSACWEDPLCSERLTCCVPASLPESSPFWQVLLNFTLFHVCIRAEASFAFWGLMKDSRWEACGSFVTGGMPPQLTECHVLFWCSLQAESPFFSLIHFFAPFFHLPFSLLTWVTQRSHRGQLPAHCSAVFAQSSFCGFKDYAKGLCGTPAHPAHHQLTSKLG